MSTAERLLQKCLPLPDAKCSDAMRSFINTRPQHGEFLESGVLVNVMRVLVTVLLALRLGAADALLLKCDNIQQLSNLKGAINAKGGADPSEPCGWHIHPDRPLQKIEFLVNESRLEGSDEIAFYSLELQHTTSLVGRFDFLHPVPPELELRGAAAWPKVRGSQR